MNWKREEDEKPPFDTPVLAWRECKGCKNQTVHRHDLMARQVPTHGAFIASYYSPDPGLVEYRRAKGDRSWDHRLEPMWAPEKPTYWCVIEEP